MMETCVPLLFTLLFILFKNFKWYLYCFFSLMLMLIFVKNSFVVYYGMKILSSVIFLDYLSLGLVILFFWIFVLMLLGSVMIYKMNYFVKLYMLNLGFLAFALLVSFLSSNYIMFYFFFEFSLIPTFILILGWGNQAERLQAGLYLMFYTLAASLPLILGILYLNTLMGSSSMIINKKMFYICDMSYYSFMENLFMLIMVTAFLVKMPLYFFHLWLGKAHVEAPVSGSMILAGVLLKLGGYGIFRVFMKFNYFSLLITNNIIVGLSVLGMIYIGLKSVRMADLKLLVAYSSVSHMGLVIIGLFSYQLVSGIGGLAMMISHGLGSSGLFCLVNMYYERLGSRSIYLNKGIINVLSLSSLLMFLLVVSNISGPPSINLFSEVSLLIGVVCYSKFNYFLLPLSIMLVTIFSMYLFTYTQHGKNLQYLMGFYNFMISEIHSIWLHVYPIYLLIISLECFFQ